MKLEHVAIWTHQLERLKEFYRCYFDAVAGDKYTSEKGSRGRFESYFLSFDSGARLELMELPAIPYGAGAGGYESTGLTHIAFSIETPEKLESLYARLKNDGITTTGEPRMTGDGYYEACILDPDGNRVEITVANT